MENREGKMKMRKYSWARNETVYKSGSTVILCNSLIAEPVEELGLWPDGG
jgi:hypothetical protein